MKKVICIILSILMLVASLVGCGNSSTDDGKNSSASATLTEEPTVDWTDFTIVLNGETFSLPLDYYEVEEKTGYHLFSDENMYHSDGYIKDEGTSMAYGMTNGKNTISVEFVNATGASRAAYTECPIYSVEQKEEDIASASDAAVFPGDLYVGKEVTEEEITHLLGKTEYSYNQEGDWGYQYYSGEGDPYKYFIDVHNGKINSLFLEKVWHGEDYEEYMGLSQNTEEITDDSFSENELKGEPTVDWTDFSFTLNDKQLSLSVSYSEFVKKTGYSVFDEHDPEYVPGPLCSVDYDWHWSWTQEEATNYTNSCSIRVQNLSRQDKLAFADCDVVEIGQSTDDLYVSRYAVIFPGGLYVNKKITPKELVQLFGTPDEVGRSKSIPDTWSFTYYNGSSYRDGIYVINVCRGKISALRLSKFRYENY